MAAPLGGAEYQTITDKSCKWVLGCGVVYEENECLIKEAESCGELDAREQYLFLHGQI